MKCVICKSSEIEIKKVDEEIKLGSDIFLVSVQVLVCLNCGERYYDTKAMRKLEEMREKLRRKAVDVEDVGKVKRAKVA
jgi:YgiT-type zinc finger domain-containing protein